MILYIFYLLDAFYIKQKGAVNHCPFFIITALQGLYDLA